MNSNMLIKIGLFILLIIKTGYSCGTTLQDQNNNINPEPTLYINQSSYNIDKNLTNSGYSLKNEKNNLIFLYKNKPISVSQFFSMGPNKAKKLFIILKDTLKNPDIYLNEVLLSKKTDNAGISRIDSYQKKGNYHLQLTNNQNKSSLNYYFSLTDDTRLICSGINNLNCKKESY